MLALDWLSHAHRARDVKTEDDRDVLTTHQAVLSLSCSLEKICHFVTLRHLLFFDHDLISLVAEFAVPELVVVLDAQLAILVKDALATRTDKWVSSGDFSLVSKATQRHLCHIGIKLVSILACLFLGHEASH